jgi:hypothetical protein
MHEYDLEEITGNKGVDLVFSDNEYQYIAYFNKDSLAILERWIVPRVIYLYL